MESLTVGMVFSNRVSGHQVMIARNEFGFIHYSSINGVGHWYVSERVFIKYHSIYCGSIV